MSNDYTLNNTKAKELIWDVIRHARMQNYTPTMLCQLQKIVETKYYYWWIMDMKKEEYAVELFAKDFKGYYNGHLMSDTPKGQAVTSKWVNAPMTTMHMGHQPLVWLIDENHARGVFQYEDHQLYETDGYKVETQMVYCDDFEKDPEGVWHIQTMRMFVKQEDGQYKTPFPPKDWEPKEWEEVALQQ